MCCFIYLIKNSQAVKKGVRPLKRLWWKKMWNPRWRPRNGCDGRLMVKILITTIQVNFVPRPSGTKFTWIVVIKIFTINLPSQPFLGRHLGFHIFFHHSLFKGRTPFFTAWLFLIRYIKQHIKYLWAFCEFSLVTHCQASWGAISGTKFTWIVVIKIFTINLTSQPFLGRHLGFQIFFHDSLFKGRTPSFTAWLFLIRFHFFLYLYTPKPAYGQLWGFLTYIFFFTTGKRKRWSRFYKYFNSFWFYQ